MCVWGTHRCQKTCWPQLVIQYQEVNPEIIYIQYTYIIWINTIYIVYIYIIYSVCNNNEIRGDEFERRHRGGTQKRLKGGKGRNDVIIISKIK